MVVIKIFQGIQNHFSTRVAEWGLAIMLVNWGIRLLFPDDVLATYPAFHNMGILVSEELWGIYCVAVGVLRLMALAVNGTFSGTVYAKYSPHFRGICAALSCLFWAQIMISMLAIVPIHPGFSVYSVLLALDIYCVARTLNEAGKQIGQR